MRSLRSSSVLWISLIAAGVSLRPTSSNSLWFELSRGAAVLDGNVWPSLRLLVNERVADADWLAGVPFAVAYFLWDVHGLMTLKISGVVLAVLVGWRLAGDSCKARKSSLLGLGLLASLASWDVAPQFWDVIGIVVLFGCLGSNRSKLWLELLVLAVWSHLGNLVVVGLVTWCLTRWLERCRKAEVLAGLGRKKWFAEVLLATVACSLNPRGAMSLWDSLRLAVPRIACEGATLLETEWRPLSNTTWEVSHVAFAILAGLGLGCGIGRLMAFGFGVLVVLAVALGMMCSAHVGIAGMWLSLLLLRRECVPSASVATALPARFRCSQNAWRLAIVPLIIAAWWPWEGRRSGWGLDARLDERLLAEAISKCSMNGTVWADDELSAGMCLWVTNQRLKIQDTSRRALLGGRLREFVRLRRDFEQGRLAAYRRDDDSVGGWWLPLRERETVLLVVSAERCRLLRALEPTLWKPLALDSPVLPFGESGVPEVSPRILDVLRQRDFIETQAWSPALMGPTGTDRLWDLWGCLKVSPNIEQELRQARVFRALQRPRAALRVLEPALQVSRSQALQLEAAGCQRELAFDPLAQWKSNELDFTVVPPDTSRCAACHAEQAAGFATTGHHNALLKLDDNLTREVLGPATASQPVEKLGVRLWSDSDSGPFMSSSKQTTDPVPSQWLFGSGKHARTPVSVWLNADGAAEVLEHRLSWYPQHGWDVTLGLQIPNESAPQRTPLESLGKIHDPAAARDCFGCHTTHSPLANDTLIVRGAPIVPGVSCDRCHPGSESHARCREQGSVDESREQWRSLTPLESVNRCGECHRRADHFTPNELKPDNPMLIRFASVGLVQSACFRQQTSVTGDDRAMNVRSRFDCLTCHDPHRPAASDARYYSARCATCHNTAATKCSQQPVDSNCLPCHMPKVEVQSPLRFTDHWIRIRKSP